VLELSKPDAVSFTVNVAKPQWRERSIYFGALKNKEEEIARSLIAWLQKVCKIERQ
jgi:hypothetical protein